MPTIIIWELIVKWLDDIEKLLQTGSLEVQPGVFVRCGKEINLKIFAEGTKTVIDVYPPKLYVQVNELFQHVVLSIIKPDIDKIILDNDKMTIVINNLPDKELVITRN